MTTSLRHIATEPSNLHVEFTETMARSSPKLKNKSKSHGGVSDSDVSTETNSLSADHNSDNGKSPAKNHIQDLSGSKSKQRQRGADWEVINTKENEVVDKVPAKLEGYLLKKRKWPLKGWHKRYFVLDKGSLIYAKRPADIARGKPHGSVDLGLSVISAKRRRQRIDIDAEVFIYHVKIKSQESFTCWLDSLKEHRQYRQHQLSQGREQSDLLNFTSPVLSPTADDPGVGGLLVSSSFAACEPLLPVSREGSLLRNLRPSRAAALISESSAVLEQLSGDLLAVQQKIALLRKSAENCISFSDTHSQHEGTSPVVKKDRKKFVLRRKKTKPLSGASDAGNSASVSESESGQNITSDKHSPLGGSIPSLATAGNGVSGSELAPHPNGDPLLLPSPNNDAGSDFFQGAQDVVNRLTSAVAVLNQERDKMKLLLDATAESASLSSRSGAPNSGHPSLMLASLRSALQSALQQNADLRSRLQRIRGETDLVVEAPNAAVVLENDFIHRNRHPSLSYSSSCVSQSEFFDAKEYLTDGAEAVSDTSSDASEGEAEGDAEAEEEGSVSETSEAGNEVQPDIENQELLNKCTTGRRSKLPAPMPSSEDLSLWNLLKRNIGKDLSKVSMPVVLNEPLSMLQRLCEELEYSELLDKAAETDDPYERMVLVAAFAVSAYGSSHVRAGRKPFNPLLGETYESIREDKGFRFVAEQVSHHPPVSVCHADSTNFTFWQDIRIKTKFWGKSMEFQPLGNVNVVLPRHGDHYCWNKITTCVHNLLGGQRWVDQYGELLIVNKTNGIQCKLNFLKASYWSSNKHEVVGTIVDGSGKVVHHLFGKWSEGLYCGQAPLARCIWRPGALPEDHELYYGFSRFAIELNDLEPSLRGVLPATDSRLRPDQRLLEEGNVSGAEATKLQLEQAQRERRLVNESEGIVHEPKWFDKYLESGVEKWEFNKAYWKARSNGFVDDQIDKLW